MSSSAEPLIVPSPDEASSPPGTGGRGRRPLMLAVGALGLLALLGAMTVNLATPVAPVDTPIVGRPAPTFRLETLDGQWIALEDLRGSAVVLNFWASWCVPCREEAPILTAADETYGPRGLRVLGVVYQDSPASARDFMTRYGQDYAGLLDPDGRTAIDYGVFGIPETFFIDRAGVVRSRQIGAVTAEEMKLRVEALLE